MSAASTVVKVVFAVVLAAFIVFLTMDALLMRTVIAVVICVVGFQVVAMKVLLVEQPSVVWDNAWDGVYKPHEGSIAPESNAPERVLSSPTKTVMTTRRMVPGPCGILVGALFGLLFTKQLGLETDTALAPFPALFFGVPSGIVAALAVNSVMDKP